MIEKGTDLIELNIKSSLCDIQEKLRVDIQNIASELHGLREADGDDMECQGYFIWGPTIPLWVISGTNIPMRFGGAGYVYSCRQS